MLTDTKIYNDVFEKPWVIEQVDNCFVVQGTKEHNKQYKYSFKTKEWALLMLNFCLKTEIDILSNRFIWENRFIWPNPYLSGHPSHFDTTTFWKLGDRTILEITSNNVIKKLDVPYFIMTWFKTTSFFKFFKKLWLGENNYKN